MSVAKAHSGKKTIDDLKKFVQSYPGAIDSHLSHIADLIENEAQNSPDRRRSGRMKNMTTKKKLRKGDAIGYEVSGTAPYTVYQHEGTGRVSAHPYIKEAFDKYAPMVTKFDLKKLLSGGGNFSSSGW